LHHLHQRRRRLLRDDSGLLRLLHGHDEGRLHLLRHDERHARLLRLLSQVGFIGTNDQSPALLAGDFSFRMTHCLSFIAIIISGVETQIVSNSREIHQGPDEIALISTIPIEFVGIALDFGSDRVNDVLAIEPPPWSCCRPFVMESEDDLPDYPSLLLLIFPFSGRARFPRTSGRRPIIA
jgi:hypothetical protein